MTLKLGVSRSRPSVPYVLLSLLLLGDPNLRSVSDCGVVSMQGVLCSLRLKLTDLICWSDRTMTSHGHMRVQCAGNDLQLEHFWLITEKGILEKMFIHAVSVRNAIRFLVTCISIWIFTERNTSAWNAASVVRVTLHWWDTCDRIPERNRFHVLFVPNGFHWEFILLFIIEDTAEINRSSVTCVQRPLFGQPVYTVTSDSMQVRNNRLIALFVINCHRGGCEYWLCFNQSSRLWQGALYLDLLNSFRRHCFLNTNLP